MALLNWSTENSVGVEELDKQHQKLFSIINNLYDSMNRSEAQGEVKRILKELVEYADYHFQTEQKYFEKFNYGGATEHDLLHDKYKEKIVQFFDESKDGVDKAVPFEILDFLEDWWFSHINNEDKKYTECFVSHGLK